MRELWKPTMTSNEPDPDGPGLSRSLFDILGIEKSRMTKDELFAATKKTITATEGSKGEMTRKILVAAQKKIKSKKLLIALDESDVSNLEQLCEYLQNDIAGGVAEPNQDTPANAQIQTIPDDPVIHEDRCNIFGLGIAPTRSEIKAATERMLANHKKGQEKQLTKFKNSHQNKVNEAKKNLAELKKSYEENFVAFMKAQDQSYIVYQSSLNRLGLRILAHDESSKAEGATGILSAGPQTDSSVTEDSSHINHNKSHNAIHDSKIDLMKIEGHLSQSTEKKRKRSSLEIDEPELKDDGHKIKKAGNFKLEQSNVHQATLNVVSEDSGASQHMNDSQPTNRKSGAKYSYLNKRRTGLGVAKVTKRAMKKWIGVYSDDQDDPYEVDDDDQTSGNPRVEKLGGSSNELKPRPKARTAGSPTKTLQMKKKRSNEMKPLDHTTESKAVQKKNEAPADMSIQPMAPKVDERDPDKSTSKSGQTKSEVDGKHISTRKSTSTITTAQSIATIPHQLTAKPSSRPVTHLTPAIVAALTAKAARDPELNTQISECQTGFEGLNKRKDTILQMMKDFESAMERKSDSFATVSKSLNSEIAYFQKELLSCNGSTDMLKFRFKSKHSLDKVDRVESLLSALRQHWEWLDGRNGIRKQVEKSKHQYLSTQAHAFFHPYGRFERDAKSRITRQIEKDASEVKNLFDDLYTYFESTLRQAKRSSMSNWVTTYKVMDTMMVNFEKVMASAMDLAFQVEIHLPDWDAPDKARLIKTVENHRGYLRGVNLTYLEKRGLADDWNKELRQLGKAFMVLEDDGTTQSTTTSAVPLIGRQPLQAKSSKSLSNALEIATGPVAHPVQGSSLLGAILKLAKEDPYAALATDNKAGGGTPHLPANGTVKEEQTPTHSSAFPKLKRTGSDLPPLDAQLSKSAPLVTTNSNPGLDRLLKEAIDARNSGAKATVSMLEPTDSDSGKQCLDRDSEGGGEHLQSDRDNKKSTSELYSTKSVTGKRTATDEDGGSSPLSDRPSKKTKVDDSNIDINNDPVANNVVQNEDVGLAGSDQRKINTHFTPSAKPGSATSPAPTPVSDHVVDQKGDDEVV